MDYKLVLYFILAITFGMAMATARHFYKVWRDYEDHKRRERDRAHLTGLYDGPRPKRRRRRRRKPRG